MIFSFINPSEEDVKNASEHVILNYYAAKASINPQLSVPSVPLGTETIYHETLDRYGPHVSLMAISDLQGVLQSFFVGLLNAKRVLEIGSFTGSSAIYFANALKRNGVSPGPDAGDNMPVVGLDISEEFASIARDNFDRAGVSGYVNIIVGDARENLAKLEGQQFEVIFIDADKPSYKYYYDTILEKNLLSKGGLIIIDNTALWKTVDYLNKPVDNVETEAISKMPLENVSVKQLGRALHDFNEYIRNDPRTEVVMFPVFTGMSFVRILDNV
ncbi:hypothetical protein LPJ57_007709 [Coemansia sp. RSA 486]|nr:hypothetical protein LPJ57_007709 [Coemansia sp. RSA 486]